MAYSVVYTASTNVPEHNKLYKNILATTITASLVFLLFFVSSLVVGCAPVVNEDNNKTAVGIAEMSQDGTLTIQMFDTPKGVGVEISKPTDPYYEEHIQMVGGIKPGEKKYIRRSVGLVHMNADGSISFVLYGGGTRNGEQYRVTGDARPGEPSYNAMLLRVGGLKPGESKTIPEKNVKQSQEQ